jgi:hypothetical protein
VQVVNAGGILVIRREWENHHIEEKRFEDEKYSSTN